MSERNIILVGYTHPNNRAAWDTVKQHAASVHSVILNPNSGVGASQDAAYVTLIAELKALGIKILGYVSTRYGQRTLSDVSSEMRNWKQWYQPTGFFLDETSASVEHVPHYRQLIDNCFNLTGPESVIVGNPGQIPDRAYASIPKVIWCVFESDPASYEIRDFSAPWLVAIRPRTYHIIFRVKDAAKVLAKVRHNNPGFYVMVLTEGNDPQFAVEDTIWPDSVPSITPTPTTPPTPAITENEATKILIETSNIIGIGIDQTIKDVPARARAVMAELAAREEAPSLVTATASELLGEVGRRMK